MTTANQKTKKGKSGSRLEDRALTQILELGLPSPQTQFRFSPPRRWLFDFAYPDRKIAIEVEGGTFGPPVFCPNCKSVVFEKTKDGRRIPVRSSGRHNRGAGFEKDAEKYNTAGLLGWRVFKITSQMISKRQAGELVKRILET